MTTILLTGATGFVGNRVATELCRSGLQVKASVRRVSNVLPSQVNQVFIKDLFNATDAELDNLLQNVDIVIHCAWYVDHSDYVTSTENLHSLVGTVRLASAAIRNKVKKFVGIGTCAEYDWGTSDKFSAGDPVRPHSPYGAAKAACYLALKSAFGHAKIEFLWCRLFYTFGSGENPKRLGAMIKYKIENNEEICFDNSEKVIDFLHIKAVARNIVELSLGYYTGPHNICSGIGQSVKKFALDYAKSKNKIHLVNTSKQKTDHTNNTKVVGYPTLKVNLSETKL